MMNFLTFGVREGHVDIVPARPYLCRIVSMAMAFILLAFLALNLGLPVSHSIGGWPRALGVGTAMRHGELMGSTSMIRKSVNRFSVKIMLKQGDEIMMRTRIMIERPISAALQDRRNRTLA
jgi:hypothetical protein